MLDNDCLQEWTIQVSCNYIWQLPLAITFGNYPWPSYLTQHTAFDPFQIGQKQQCSSQSLQKGHYCTFLVQIIVFWPFKGSCGIWNGPKYCHGIHSNIQTPIWLSVNTIGTQMPHLTNPIYWFCKHLEFKRFYSTLSFPSITRNGLNWKLESFDVNFLDHGKLFSWQILYFVDHNFLLSLT